VERQSVVKIFGEEYSLKARVETINGFSAHADRKELLGYAEQLGAPRIKAAYVVHGEEAASLSLADGLDELGVQEAIVPKRGEAFEV
jgi:metallo-beta-lactamase family protein